jgi:hypothetical protein
MFTSCLMRARGADFNARSFCSICCVIKLAPKVDKISFSIRLFMYGCRRYNTHTHTHTRKHTHTNHLVNALTNGCNNADVNDILSYFFNVQYGFETGKQTNNELVPHDIIHRHCVDFDVSSLHQDEEACQQQLVQRLRHRPSQTLQINLIAYEQNLNIPKTTHVIRTVKQTTFGVGFLGNVDEEFDVEKDVENQQSDGVVVEHVAEVGVVGEKPLDIDHYAVQHDGRQED